MKKTIHFSNTSVVVEEAALFGLIGLRELQDKIFEATATCLVKAGDAERYGQCRQELNERLETYEQSLRSVKQNFPELGEEVPVLNEITVS